jgi:lysyl-tRNA synthetase class 2
VRVIAAFVAAGAAANLAAAGRPDRWGRLAAAVDGGHLLRPHLLLLALILLVLARGLAGRRRAAHQLLFGMLAIDLLTSFREYRLRAVALLAALVVLALLRDRFATRPDPQRVRRAAEVAAVVSVLALVYGAGSVTLANHPVSSTRHAVVAGLTAEPVRDFRYAVLLSLLAGGGLLVALVLLLAPAPPPPPGDRRERAEVAALVATTTGDTLAPFALRADKAYVFSPDRRAAIGYRVLLGTAVAGGDPVGAPDAHEAAVAAYLSECARRGWRPAVLGAGERAAALWRARGLRGVGIGDEAVIDVARFRLGGRRMRNVRQAVRRTHNAGITVAVADSTDRLAPVVADWLRGGRERGFAMNLDGLTVPRPDCLLLVASDAAGEPVAFARFALCRDALTLDVAPRRRDAPNGVVERLVVAAVEVARERGLGQVSLNFAAFRPLYEARQRTAVERAGAGLLRFFDRWVELEPLFRFTAKFRPGWRPRAVLLPSWFQVGWVLAAMVGLEFALPYARRRPPPDLPTELAPDLVR